MKQTAVEWLVEQLYPALKLNSKLIDDFVEEAKAMEKQQTIDFTDNYILECLTCSYNGEPTSLKETEEYYKETFGK